MRILVDTPTAGGTRFRPMARWLALGTVLLILYGSLYPFHFQPPAHIDLIGLLGGLSFQRSSRSDLVANLLLYLPLGLSLMLSWPGGWGRLKGFGWTVALGSLLSLIIELLQVYESQRVSSLTDFLLNAAGTFLGALLAIVYFALGRSIRIPGIAGGRPEPVPLMVLLLWLAFRLAPFVPSFDWQKYKTALAPLLVAPQLSPMSVFQLLTGWLVAGYAVRQVWRREYAIAALAGVVALVLLGRIVIVGKTLAAAELVALALAGALGAMLATMKERRRLGALAILLAAAIALEGLRPFEFQAHADAFSWVPFKSSISGSLEIHYSVMLEKCFRYFALVWLLARRGFGAGGAALATALLLAAIEALQMWLPGRSAEITDPLLALTAGILLALAGGRPVHSNARFQVRGASK